METIFQPTPQELAIGTMVAVRLNERNRTPHKGIVADAIWHYKIGKWHYYL